MATDSFTSAAAAVSRTSATLSQQGDAVLSPHGFKVRINNSGVFVTKAPTLGGTQAALTFPLARYDAQELALLLLQLAN